MGTPAPEAGLTKNQMLCYRQQEQVHGGNTQTTDILYDHEHRLTQQDVDMANGYVELIERTRSEKIPQVGDRLIYVDRYGKYYATPSSRNAKIRTD